MNTAFSPMSSATSANRTTGKDKCAHVLTERHSLVGLLTDGLSKGREPGIGISQRSQDVHLRTEVLTNEANQWVVLLQLVFEDWLEEDNNVVNSMARFHFGGPL